MKLINWLGQVGAVTWMNLRNLPARPSSSIVAMLGIAGVVAVLVAILSISAGFEKTLAGTGSPDTAVVIRSGSNSELSSGISSEDARIISQAPGIAQGPDGPLASSELYVVVDVPKRSTDTDANVPLRGVQETAFAVRSALSIREGRVFKPGLREIIVGQAASGQFAGLDVGTTLTWGSNDWDVVGIFEDGGSLSESEIWTDARVLQDAYNRGSSFQTVRVRLESVDAFQTFADALSADSRLDVAAERENDFYAGQSGVLTAIINALGGAITGLMGIGAIFAAILTMYAAVSARTREIATLRALGFGRAPIVISVLIESLVLGIVGGVLGGLVAYFGFNGFQTSTLNWASFSQVSFAFAVTLPLLITGLIYALVMGLFGGLLPSLRAARMPITVALREL